MLYQEHLKNLKVCPFCVLLPSDRALLERQHAYLTYARAPYHAHHLLVIPKRHIVSFFEINENERKEIDELIVLATTTLKKLNYNSFSILVREGGDSDKSVPHLHYHVIPDIHLGDLDHLGRPRKMLEDKEVTALREDILRAFPQIGKH